MKKVIGLLFFILLSICSYCFAQALSSGELINNAKQYDGKSVTYAGEVVGDVMRRGEYAWVNLGDKDNAIGIWIKYSDVGQINYKGSYKSRGDILQITGIFNRGCKDHGGDLDIHATEARNINSGKDTAEKINLNKVNSIVILAVALILIWILNLLRHRLKKN